MPPEIRIGIETFDVGSIEMTGETRPGDFCALIGHRRDSRRSGYPFVAVAAFRLLRKRFAVREKRSLIGVGPVAQRLDRL